MSLRDDVGRNAVEHDLGPPEHLEAPWLLDDAPRQVDEPTTGWPRNVRAPEISQIGKHRSCFQLPADAHGVRTHPTHQLAGLVFALDADLDPMVALGTLRRRTTGSARQIVRLDADQHANSMRRITPQRPRLRKTRPT